MPWCGQRWANNPGIADGFVYLLSQDNGDDRFVWASKVVVGCHGHWKLFEVGTKPHSGYHGSTFEVFTFLYYLPLEGGLLYLRFPRDNQSRWRAPRKRRDMEDIDRSY